MSQQAKIEAFDGPYRFLSNFWIEPDKTCVEVEYQRAKCVHQSDRDDFNNLTAMAAKARGTWIREAGRQREDWEEVKVEIMWFYVAKKFADHEDLWTHLLLTGSATLIEGNHWHDTFWGVCYGRCYSAKKPRHTPSGANGLGEILMQVRAMLVPESLQKRYDEMIPF